MNNIRNFYLFKLCSALFISVPIFVLFRQDNGLSLTQIMFLQSFYAIIAVVLEVPSGYFADVFGRKKSIVIGSIFVVLGHICYALGYDFLVFLVAEGCMGIGLALISGADDALVYDTLKDQNKESEYKKILGNSKFIFLGTMAIMNICGGLIAKYGFFGLEQFTANNYRLLVYMDVLLFIRIIPISLRLKEPSSHNPIIRKGYMLELLQTIKATVFRQKKLLQYMIFTATIYGFYQCILWFYQPYFSFTGLDVLYFGIIFAAYQIFSAISAKRAYKIEKKLGVKRSLFTITVITGGSYLLMGSIVATWSFLFGFFQQFVRGFYSVVTSDYINHHTDSSVRATVLSIQNMFGRLVYAIILPIFGRVADVYTLTQTFLVMGISTLVIGLIFWRCLQYKKAI